MRSFSVEASESIARVARVGLPSVDVAVDALVHSVVFYNPEIFIFEEIHLFELDHALHHLGVAQQILIHAL